MLNDADILITGGTGSFGRAIVRHLLTLDAPPRRVIVFSRDELKQHEMARELGYRGEVEGERLRFFVGDVRDEARLRQAFRGVDYVIHAAAMKQVPACEYNPTEAIATNIGGAVAVVEAAIDSGVKRVVALSTDKAVNPANLYGATKLCAEKLFTAANALAGSLETRFACVRYGNVLGSRASVLQVWRAQLAAGQKVSLTSPLMTRFWVSLPSAVAYVLSVLERMRGAEIFVPKLPSCSMLELAQMLAPEAGWERIPVRRGEKMHETLISADEAGRVQAWPAEFVITPEPVPEGEWRLQDDFTYRSDTNDYRLTPELFRKLLAQTP
jgi:UDP-N-acetylglucosamine 4,6-dehydratase